MIVMTMLLILSVMTYARIESFRDLIGLKSQFEWYMQEYERNYSNEANDKKYKKQNPKKGQPGDDPDTRPEAPARKACSKLSLYYLLKKKDREANHDVYNQQILLAKLLIHQLYSDAPFFIKAEEKYPDIVDATLQSLMNAAEKLPKNQKITNAADLASINLGDEQLNEFFYHILKGTVKIDEQDEAETYPSLIDYVSVENKPQVRVYLAPHDLLMAIYGNEGLVKEVEEIRNSLYEKVKDESMTKEEATQEFEKQIGNKQREGIDEKTLNFWVSKTNPKTY